MATILIVDDSQTMRRLLRKMLEELGHEVIGEAANGFLATVLYKKLLPDVVTMDYAMPVMDGLEATRRIKESHLTSNVIVISSNQDDDQVDKMRECGVDFYLLKPLHKGKLKAVLDMMLENDQEEDSGSSI